MVDLPHHSVVVGGLEDWTSGGTSGASPEDWLVRSSSELLEHARRCSSTRRRPTTDDPTVAPTGHHRLGSSRSGSSRRRSPAAERAGRGARACSSTAARWRRASTSTDDGKPQPVVPIRFVQACRQGAPRRHRLVRLRPRGRPASAAAALWIEERGTSGDLPDVLVRCECGEAAADGRARPPRCTALGRLRRAAALARAARRARVRRTRAEPASWSAPPATPTSRRC